MRVKNIKELYYGILKVFKDVKVRRESIFLVEENPQVLNIYFAL